MTDVKYRPYLKAELLEQVQDTIDYIDSHILSAQATYGAPYGSGSIKQSRAYDRGQLRAYKRVRERLEGILQGERVIE